MAIEQHPQYSAWRKALQEMIEAEERYHIALMEERSTEEVEAAARDLDGARGRYRAVTDKIG
jgi:hypothetical protein